MKLYSHLAAALLISGTFVLSAHAQLYWDIDTISQAGAGGTAPAGTWDDFTANWNINADGTGVPGIWSSGSVAVFGAGDSTTGATGTYTVTVGAPETVGGINFEEGTVTIAGAPGLTLGGSGIIDVASGRTGVISAPITGFTSIAKNGAGTLTLSADNTAAGFLGGVDVNNGTLNITNAGAIGPGGDFTPIIVHDGGTLQVSTTAMTVTPALTINGMGFNNLGAIRKTSNVAISFSGGITLGSASRIRSEQNTLTISGSPILMGSNDLTFAGTATGTTGNTTVSTTISSNDGTTITKEGQGTLTLSGNNISTLKSKFKVTGGVLAWSSDNSFTNNLGVAPAAFTPDYVVVDGGTIRMTTSDTTGTSFMRANRGIQLGPNGGTIDQSSTATGAKSIYTSGDTATVVGTGGIIGLTSGTTAATLTKVGAGEFRAQGSGTASYAFTKLVVKAGLYRIGSQVTNTIQLSKETGFGAVPSIFTQDALTLDGGSIASTVAFTLNANRGVTMTSNGGGLQGGITISTPLVSATPGSGTLRQEAGTNILSSATNVTSFDANLAANGGTLQLNSSLNVRDFSGTASGTAAADVNINGSAVKLTVGNGTPTNTTFNGRLLGTGKFRKVGSNTITFDMAGTGNLLKLSGTGTDVFVIDGGGITLANTIATSVAGFDPTVAGTLAVTPNVGTLDMTTLPLAGGVYTHNFGSLVSTATTGSVLMGTNNITLGQTATTARSYLGTITSTGGTLTKGGSSFTQTLGAGNTLAAVNVNAGRLNFTGASTTGAVTVNTGGTLGGNGSVSGAVSVQSGGILAPGTSIGTFGEGALSMFSGSTFQYELNTSGTPAADLLNVNGALSLGGATLFTDDLNATPLALAGGSKFALMSYSGAWDTTTFNGIANGSTVAVDGINYTIKYDDTSVGSLNGGSLYSSAVTLSIPGASCAPGDLNCDSHEDAADYAYLRKQHSDITSGGGLTDYTAWRTNFGTPPGSGSGGGLSGAGAVPEPSSIALLMFALGAMATRRRGR